MQEKQLKCGHEMCKWRIIRIRVYSERCVSQNPNVRVSRDFAEFEHLKVAHLVRICISKTQSEKTKSE